MRKQKIILSYSFVEETDENTIDCTVSFALSSGQRRRAGMEVEMKLIDILGLNQVQLAPTAKLTKGILVAPSASSTAPSLANLQEAILNYHLNQIDIDLDTSPEIPDRVVETGDSRGMLTSVQVIRDVLGSKVRTKTSTRTYYPSGCVDVWTLIQLDASDSEIGRTEIKHSENPNIQPIARVTGTGG